MNPEANAIHNLDKRKRIDDIEDAARKLLPLHEKVAPILEKLALNPLEFNDKRVEQDLMYVTERKREMNKVEHEMAPGNNRLTIGEIKKLSEILEYQIIKGINMHGWIPDCRAIKTSEYDDIRNGVDMIVEFYKNEQIGHIGLGVDASFSHHLVSKFQRIKADIIAYDGERNVLSEVRYFKSDRSGIKGELFGIPRVVAALDVGVMEDMARNPKTLEKHMAKHALLIEIKRQLNAFSDFAKRVNPACLPQIERAKIFIEFVIREKTNSEEILRQSEYHRNDQIEAALDEGLALFR